MPVPSSISDLTNIAATNSPAGTESVKGTIDDYLRAHAAFIRQLADTVAGPTVTLASAPTVAIGFAGSGNIAITGSTTISAFDSAAEGTMRWVIFAGSMALIYNAASLILPAGASIQTVPGDAALFKSLGGGNWLCMAYLRNSVQMPATGALLSSATAVTVAQGGTGATTAAGARSNLGVPASASVVLLSASNSSAGTFFESASLQDIAGIPSVAYDNGPLTVTNGNNVNASAVISFYRTGGAYAAYLGLDTDNKWKVGGRSMGPVAYEIYHQGNFSPANYAAISGAAFSGNISAPVVTETSDERKKKLWQRLPHDFVTQLAGLKKSGLFTWRKGNSPGIGVGAQSLERILPIAVHTDKHGAKSVQYGAAAMVSVVELARAYVAMEKRLAVLEAK